MSDGAPAQAEFVIATILPEAYESIVRMCNLTKHTHREGYQWTWGTIDRRDGGSVTVVVRSSLDRENIASGPFVDSMIRAWKPDNVLVVDIAGGVKGREGIALGDVVVHTHLHYYDFHKIDEEGNEEPRYMPLPGASSYLRELAHRPFERGDTAWLDQIQAERPDDGLPKVLSGEMLSGGTLLAKSKRLDRLLDDHKKALAVEMDGAGPARAVLDSGLRGPQAEFLVIRGISDFCNDGQGVNQATREAWRRYAAEAAAALATTILREVDGTRASAGAVEATQTPAPAEPVLPAPWAKLPAELGNDGRHFFELSFKIKDDTYSIAELGQTARQVGRLALLGTAGAGKTFATLHILRACELTTPVIFVGRDGWARELGDRLLAVDFDEPRPDWAAALDVLLRGATVDVTVEQLRAVAEAGPVILAVDSLNSASPEVATRILDTLNLARRQLQRMTVIVTDRSETRYPEGGNWTVASIAKLDPEVGQRRIDDQYGPGAWAQMSERAQRLLGSPFFLRLALEGAGLESHTRSQALAKFVAGQAGLSEAAITEIARQTAAAYVEGRRNLSKGALSETTRDTLVEAGLITPPSATTERLAFAHELYGDYFASLHLVGQSGEWQSDDLSAISFSGERWKFEGLSADTDSFDAITLAAEQMPRGAGDAFLRAVYDWNWRAAVDCLGATQPVDGPFSEAARLVVLALLSERRGDPVDGTRKRASRLLARLPDPIAGELARASEHDDREIIAGCSFDAPWFEPWQRVFCRDSYRPWTPRELSGICSPDTLHGWTVSYALKRAPLDRETCARLIGIYEGARAGAGEASTLQASIRWRTVHSLAAGEGEELLDLLLRAMDDDPYPWVQWGAARSVTEFAARCEDPERSALAIDALADRAADLPIAVVMEIAWAAQYRGAVPHFPELVKPLLKKLENNVHGEVVRDQWRYRRAQLESFWDNQQHPS